jgi:hypothetical protein
MFLSLYFPGFIARSSLSFASRSAAKQQPKTLKSLTASKFCRNSPFEFHSSNSLLLSIFQQQKIKKKFSKHSPLILFPSLCLHKNKKRKSSSPLFVTAASNTGITKEELSFSSDFVTRPGPTPLSLSLSLSLLLVIYAPLFGLVLLF